MYTSSPSYLRQSNQGFYFRLALPKSLRGIIGLWELRYPILAKSLKEARAKAKNLGRLIRGFLDNLKWKLKRRMPIELTQEQILALVDEYALQVLDDCENHRIGRGRITEMSFDGHLCNVEEGQDLLAEALQDNDLNFIETIADDLLKSKGLSVCKEDELYKKFCHGLLRSLHEVTTIEKMRINGDYSHEYILKSSNNKLCNNPSTLIVKEENESVKLKDMIEAYVKHKKLNTDWTEKTENENKACWQLFLDFAGEDITVDKIDYDLVISFKEALTKLPANMKKNPQYRDKTLHEILAMDDIKPMSSTTINKNMNRLSSVLKYVVSRKLMSINPAEGMESKKKRRARDERSEFSLDDLRALFLSDEYVNDLHKYSFQYWTPIIALFTGMRQDEIAQLHIDDIRQLGGIWIFDVNDKDEKKLKSGTAAMRQIPMHPFLANVLRLPQYAKMLKTKGEVRLFPEIKKGRDGYGQKVSRWFNGHDKDHRGYRHRCGVNAKEGEPSKVFHSFRHTFIGHLKMKRVPTEIFLEINGHAHGNESLDRYSPEYQARLGLDEVISKIDFHLTIPLDHLKNSKWCGPK